MISKALLLLTWILSIGGAQPSFAAPSSHPPGEIDAVQNFRFAYERLGDFYDFCLAAPSCLTDEKDRALINAIRQFLNKESEMTDQLRFESGQAHPTRFLIDGKIRIAVTGSEIGSPIFINTDLLNVPREPGRAIPLSIESAASILTHEFGHHHGIFDHFYLDGVGARIKTFLLRSLQWQKHPSEQQDPQQRPMEIQAGILQWPTPLSSQGLLGAETRFFIADELSLHALDETLWKQLSHDPLACPAPDSMLGFRFLDFHWTDWGWPDDASQGKLPGTRMSARIFFTAKARIYLRCQSGFRTGLNMEFTLSFDNMRENRDYYTYWRYIPEVTLIRLLPIPALE